MNRTAKLGGSLLGKGDRIISIVFVAMVLASLVAAAIIPSFVQGITYYTSFAAVAAPFVILGIYRGVADGHWIRLGASVVISVLLTALDWRVGAAALMLLVGSEGVSACAELAQRALLLRVLGRIERCGADDSRMSRFTAFMLDIPSGVDPRNLRLNRTVIRDRYPWDQMLRSMMPAFVLMLLVWMFAAASYGFRADLWDDLLLLLAISMYASALSVSVFVLGTLDIRIGGSGAVFRPFEGLYGTLCRMAMPAVIALLVILAAVDPGWDAVIATVASGAFCMALMVLSIVSYSVEKEQGVVADVSEAWSGSHPVDFDSGFDGKGAGHPLDDAVPGTPRRPEDWCFDRRN